MSDSYHFQIEPEPAKEALFRVGGVYRQQNGVLVRLTGRSDGCAQAQRVHPDDRALNSGGARRLSDGRYVFAASVAEYECHLIPGELIHRSGEWVPMDAPATIGPFPSGATLTVSGDKVVGRTEPEVQRAPLPNSDAWRYTGNKHLDTFGADFTVTRGGEFTFSIPAGPSGKGTLHEANANLFRG